MQLTNAAKERKVESQDAILQRTLNPQNEDTRAIAAVITAQCITNASGSLQDLEPEIQDTPMDLPPHPSVSEDCLDVNPQTLRSETYDSLPGEWG